MLSQLLRTYLRPYKKVILIIVALQLVQTMATLTLPSLNADIIDNGILKGDTDYIWSIGRIMLGISLVQVVFAVGAVYFGSKAAMGVGRDVRDGLFHKVTNFSTQEVAHFGAPSLITRITNDVTQVQVLVVMTLTMFIAAPITVVGGVFMAVREDVHLSLILVVAIPVLLLSVGLVISRLIPLFGVMQERIDRVNQVLREQITGMRVVRAFVREPHEEQRFGTANDELTETSLRTGYLMAFLFPSVMLILNVSSVAAVWIGADRIASREMKVGALVAFLTYLVQILVAVMMATFVAILWPRAAVCAVRIKEVLDTEATIVTADNAVTELPSGNAVEFDHVEFAYPGAEMPVLCDVSFNAGPGTTTAFIGSTGSGKTTLLNLVPRLFDVTGGAVRLNGVNVRDLDPQTLWAHIGLVPQKPFLFSGTVASNLRYADPEATEEQLWAALRVAQAEDFVRAMPEGLDSPITQGGTNVSGGQRQRLAIARAIVRNPGIYLFDDSFSALDLATDARLRAALAPITSKSTVLLVAQRVSTILNADQIVVLEDGRVVGLGTHHELLRGCETYQEIVASQLTEEEAA